MQTVRNQVLKSTSQETAGLSDGCLAEAEAARYAVLRRIAPTIRHHLAGSLQPLSMAAVVLQRRLQKPGADIGGLQKNADDMASMTREASRAAQHLMGWIFPGSNPSVPLSKGIEECLSMVQAELSFRGYSVESEVEGIDDAVSQSAIREVLTATILAWTDALGGAGCLVVRAEVSPPGCAIHVQCLPGEASSMVAPPLAYRHIQWSDVEALALPGAVQVLRSEDRVTLRFPLLEPWDRTES